MIKHKLKQENRCTVSPVNNTGTQLRLFGRGLGILSLWDFLTYQYHWWKSISLVKKTHLVCTCRENNTLHQPALVISCVTVATKPVCVGVLSW